MLLDELSTAQRYIQLLNRLRRAIAGTPNQGLFYMLLALGAGRAGLDGQASRLFRLHCLIHPGDLQGYYNFGNFRLRLEQKDEAAGLFARAALDAHRARPAAQPARRPAIASKLRAMLVWPSKLRRQRSRAKSTARHLAS